MDIEAIRSVNHSALQLIQNAAEHLDFNIIKAKNRPAATYLKVLITLHTAPCFLQSYSTTGPAIPQLGYKKKTFIKEGSDL